MLKKPVDYDINNLGIHQSPKHKTEDLSDSHGEDYVNHKKNRIKKKIYNQKTHENRRLNKLK